MVQQRRLLPPAVSLQSTLECGTLSLTMQQQCLIHRHYKLGLLTASGKSTGAQRSMVAAWRHPLKSRPPPRPLQQQQQQQQPAGRSSTKFRESTYCKRQVQRPARGIHCAAPHPTPLTPRRPAGPGRRAAAAPAALTVPAMLLAAPLLALLALGAVAVVPARPRPHQNPTAA